MPAGPFFFKDPISLTLAADQRFAPLDSEIDAVWQLSLEPHKALAIETSFGLQAQKFSLFPVFLINRQPVWIIHDFFSQPRIDEFYSNYARLACTPTAGFQARYELWVESSTSLLCRFALQNLTDAKAMLGIQAVAELFPLEGTAGMTPVMLQHQHYLWGRSGNLYVALAAAGIAMQVYSPFSALQSEQKIDPQETLIFMARCSVAQEEQTCLQRIFQPFPENWDVASARLKLQQQEELLEINTPFTDWDAVFLSCQNIANQALIRTQETQERLDYCPNRNPDYNYTQINHSNNKTALISPNSTLALAQLCQILLPMHTQEAAALLLAQLPMLQNPPTLPGSGRRVLSFPSLCELAVRIYAQNDKIDFVRQMYPTLREICFAWFEPEQDCDQDGFPEWALFEQTGWNDNLTFNLFNPQGYFTRIDKTESLALGHLLLNELNALQKLAQLMEDQATNNRSSELQNKLTNRLAELHSRSPELSCWDRDTHHPTKQEILFNGTYAELKERKLHLSSPAHINVKVNVDPLTPKPLQISLIGLDQVGQPCEETVTSSEILCLGECIFFTSECVYQQINQITLHGLYDQTYLIIYIADLTIKDIGWYLAYLQQPKVETTDQKEEQKVPEAVFTQAYGLPDFEKKTEDTVYAGAVNPAWNSLVLEHLIEIGAKKEAVELFNSLMRGTIEVLKHEHNLYDCYNSQSALPIGKPNGLTGLIPIKAFLELSGIRLFSPERVQITGEFPFPWRLSIHYQGLEVVRDGKNTTITLPDGTVHHHFGSQPRIFMVNESQREIKE